MLCIDHFMREQERFSHFKKRFENATIIDCTSVAKYYYEMLKDDKMSLEDIHTIAPPFNQCWLDFSAPDYIQTKKEVIHWAKTFPQQWGFDMSWHDSTQENLEHITSKLPQLWKDFMPDMTKWAETSTWFVDMYLWWRLRGTVNGPIWVWRMFLDDKGKICLHGDNETSTIEGPVHTSISEGIERMAKAKNITEKESRQRTYNQMSGFMLCALLSINFMHCRNIKMQDAPLRKVKPLNNSQRRRGDSPKEPFVKYKTLNIIPMKEAIANTEQSQGVGTKRAFHICAGHFMTYTQEKPLFGKYAGTYFVPMHAKGSLEIGKIQKDYKITMKEEQ